MTTISIHNKQPLWHPVGVPVCPLGTSGLFWHFSLPEHETDSPLSLFYVIWLRTTVLIVEYINFLVGYASCVWNQTTVCDYCPSAAGCGEICLFPDTLQYFIVYRTNFDDNGMRQRVMPPLV